MIKKVRNPASSSAESLRPNPTRSMDSGNKCPNAVPKSAPAAKLSNGGITLESLWGLQERATMPMNDAAETNATLPNV